MNVRPGQAVDITINQSKIGLLYCLGISDACEESKQGFRTASMIDARARTRQIILLNFAIGWKWSFSTSRMTVNVIYLLLNHYTFANESMWRNSLLNLRNTNRINTFWTRKRRDSWMLLRVSFCLYVRHDSRTARENLTQSTLWARTLLWRIACNLQVLTAQDVWRCRQNWEGRKTIPLHSFGKLNPKFLVMRDVSENLMFIIKHLTCLRYFIAITLKFYIKSVVQ